MYLDRAGEVSVGDVEGEGAQTVRQGQGDQQARAAGQGRPQQPLQHWPLVPWVRGCRGCLRLRAGGRGHGGRGHEGATQRAANLE